MKALGMRTRGDDLECEIYAVPGWGGFDQLVKYLTNTWSAQVTDSIDGPDARVATLAVQGGSLTLQYEDPWESTLISATPATHALLRTIAAALEARLSARQTPRKSGSR